MIMLALGIACGLFFGDYCRFLAVGGDIFVGLLQMTILPYIIVSLIGNLGRLSWQQSRRLALIGGSVLLIFWALAFATIFWLAHVFPQWQGGSFFSSAIRNCNSFRFFLFPSLITFTMGAWFPLRVCMPGSDVLLKYANIW